MTPGSTVTWRLSASTGDSVRSRDSTSRTPSALGSAPPDRPVPEPRATKGTPASEQSRTVSTTCCRLSASTTIAGVTLKLANPSHSYVRTCVRSVSTRSMPTAVRSRSASAVVRSERTGSAMAVMASSRHPLGGAGSRHALVGRQGQEVGVLVGHRHLQEQRAGVVPAAGGEGVAAGLGDGLHLLVGDALDQLAGDRLTVRELHPVVQPLPDLAAGDLRGGGVLHEVVDDDGAGAPQPRLDVLDADADVAAQARLGDLTGGGADVEQLLGRDLRVLALLVDLVGALAEDGGEDLLAELHHARVGHPGAVEAVVGLALLVGPDLGEGLLVDRRVLGGDERGHAADGVRAALVAGRDRQTSGWEGVVSGESV